MGGARGWDSDLCKKTDAKMGMLDIFLTRTVADRKQVAVRRQTFSEGYVRKRLAKATGHGLMLIR